MTYIEGDKHDVPKEPFFRVVNRPGGSLCRNPFHGWEIFLVGKSASLIITEFVPFKSAAD